MLLSYPHLLHHATGNLIDERKFKKKMSFTLSLVMVKASHMQLSYRKLVDGKLQARRIV